MMTNLIASLVLASLLMPGGLNFFTKKEAPQTQVDTMVTKSVVPKRVVTNSLGVETTASNVIIVDQESNSVLYNKNFLNKTSVASITKLMTALVVLDSDPNWDQEVKILSQDQRSGGQVYLLVGEVLSLRTVFNLMLTSSANEAAAALARVVDDENFVTRMNTKARELGMTQTTFVDPTGLDPANVSTPNDLVILANTAFAQPDILQAVKTQDYSFDILNSSRRGYGANTNKLLGSFLDSGDYQIIGAKTGFLNEAGYCLLMQVKKDDHVVTLVMLGAQTIDSRWQEAKGLIDWVYRSYQWPE